MTFGPTGLSPGNSFDRLTKFIGITGHGTDAPKIYLEALRRFDFDSILFPLNFVQMANPEYRKYTEELIATCKAKEVGTMVIKTITKGPWGERPHTATTWYEPFDKMDEIQNAVNFARSYEVTGLCTAGDTRILPLVLKACENFTQLSKPDLEEVIHSRQQFETLFGITNSTKTIGKESKRTGSSPVLFGRT